MGIQVDTEELDKRYQAFLNEMFADGITQQDIEDIMPELHDLKRAQLQLEMAIEEAEKRDAAKH